MDIIEKINSSVFLTDGGLETDLIFNKGIELPHFAAFTLLDQPEHENTLMDYYNDYIEEAIKHNAGFILESPTWRANPDWGYKLGYSQDELVQVNQKAIAQLIELKSRYADFDDTFLISGCIGPRGDGYSIIETMTVKQAHEYHNLQIRALKNAGVDMISAITMTYLDEAIGIAESAKSNNIPVVISFTVETNGDLPSGETLEKAILKIDEVTDHYPLYYMINCAHPSHFMDKIKSGGSWKNRIRGVRANASCKSHDELDQSVELDTGNKEELGKLYHILKTQLPDLKVFGGCCGTDVSHIRTICEHTL